VRKPPDSGKVPAQGARRDSSPTQGDQLDQKSGLSLQRTAVELGERFHVFPLDHPSHEWCQGVGKDHKPHREGDRGKHPACSWSRWSTQDPDKIARYFAGRAFNIGIDCGKSGILVVDEDQLGEWERVCEFLGIDPPHTFTVRTAKGRHFYFLQPPSAPFSNKEGALRGFKLNIRGAGGLVVAPGSLHETGVVYEIIDTAEIVATPTQLIDALTGKVKPSHNGETDAVMRVPPDNRGWWREGPIANGNRHHAIVAAAGWALRMGLTENEAKPIVREVLSRCQGDKYTLDDAYVRLKDVYGRYEVGTRLEERRGDSPDNDDLLAGLRNGAWLDAQDFPPLRYHLPGVIPEGSNLLVGPPKIGKSWFVLALGLAAAAGGIALGQRVDTRPVLYLALEDGHRRLQDRCRTLLDTDRIPEAFEYLTTVQPGMVVSTIEAWLARHPGAQPLVMLDTLGKVMPPALMGESSYGRDYRVGTSLKRAVDEQPGSALVTNHHDRKANSEDFVDRVSGTNGLAGAADTIIVITRPRHENDGVIQVTGRDVAEGQYAVVFDGPRGLWTLDGNGLAGAAATVAQRRANEGLDDRSRAVIGYVNKHPEGVRWGDVKRDLGEDEARYLSRLYESGRIARPSRGLYVPLSGVSGVSGFTTETDTPDTPSESGHPETDTTDTTDSAPEGTLGLFTREFGPFEDDPDDYARRLNPGELGPYEPEF
jgi:Bifunctional DNA primase/polymerase, N-terminal/AAA domain